MNSFTTASLKTWEVPQTATMQSSRTHQKVIHDPKKDKTKNQASNSRKMRVRLKVTESKVLLFKRVR